MYMENATGQEIANNISSLSVDTSGLMTDATGQDIVSAIQALAPSTPVYLSDRKISGQAVSVPDSTHTIILQLTLAAGLWLISGTASYASNATGYRQAYVTDDPDSTTAINTITEIENAVSGTITSLSFSGVVKLAASTTLYVKVRQNSGSNLNTFGVFNAVKIA